MSSALPVRRVAVLLTALLLGGLLALPQGTTIPAAFAARGCPAGYHAYSSDEADALRIPGETALSRQVKAAGGSPLVCINDKHPESPMEKASQGVQQYAVQAAPTGKIPRNAYIRAIHQRNQVLKRGQSQANRHSWQKYGKGPLQAQDKDYPGVNGLGLVELAGRITDFAYVPPTDKHLPDTLLASVAYGGVWKSTNQGKSWKPIGNKLPTQIIGSVNYTPARGGTIVVITGDGSFGRYSREGAGAWWSNNGGRKWHRARGVPSDVFGFNVAVDPKHPLRVYVATGAGLFRSSNAGRSFKNVKLPTGKCAGKSNRVKGCLLANEVTDVVVKAPGGSTSEKGGEVLAAVGWRNGNDKSPDGSVQSPKNGLYFSKSGKPGTFKKLTPSGFADQGRIGRVELGPATGPDQNHNYVYASVSDAVLSRGGSYGIDADATAGAVPTVWNGLYVSSDFGQTWSKMFDAGEAQQPGTGSALAVVAQSQANYGPGIQSWYNEWVVPDPTRQAGGVPTRLLFGLEEVWMNDDTSVPQDGHSSFHVIGRYFGGSTCLFLDPTANGLPYACPTNRGDPVTITDTTHPDQHSALFIPHQDGSVTLVVGNDGGVYTQTVDSSTDFDNDHWGVGANRGFNTLFPYHAVIAGDGTVWMGLQDNGTAKIQDTTIAGKGYKQRQIENLGGDGFFVGVDPRDSDHAYGEYVYGAMSGTTNGGKSWAAMDPPGMSSGTAQFSNPYAVDPDDPNHVMIAGNQVDETGSGPGTASTDWAVPYHLGTMKHPGRKNAQPSQTDPANIDSAIDLVGANAYVAFCGSCDPLDTVVFGKAPFHSGLATNVGGNGKPTRYQSKGWHIAKAVGLPNRYITSIEIDPNDPKTVYVAVGGYRRYWTPPGELDRNRRIGKGHLFVSHDAAGHFTDISANLPNYPVNFVRLRGKQLVLATDIGVFIGSRAPHCSTPASRRCHNFQVLGRGLPIGQVATVEVNPCDPDQLVAAVFGRGVYVYRFGNVTPCKPLPPPPPPPAFAGQKVAGPFGFETDAEGWTPKTNNTAEEWRVMPPGHNSGQSFAVSGYTNETTAVLLSPKFTLPARSSVKVTWWERTNTEPGFDYLTVDWSADGYVWYTAHSVSGMNADYPDFTRATAQFVVPKGSLYVRFRLTSDQLVSFPPYDGVAIDDVLVER